MQRGVDLSQRIWLSLLALASIQAQHQNALAGRQLLQEDFTAIGKTHRVSISEGIGALFHKCNFFDRPTFSACCKRSGRSCKRSRAPGGTQTAGLLSGENICFRLKRAGVNPSVPVLNRCTTSCSPSTAKRLGKCAKE